MTDDFDKGMLHGWLGNRLEAAPISPAPTDNELERLEQRQKERGRNRNYWQTRNVGACMAEDDLTECIAIARKLQEGFTAVVNGELGQERDCYKAALEHIAECPKESPFLRRLAREALES